jgi:hypothetical protein
MQAPRWRDAIMLAQLQVVFSMPRMKWALRSEDGVFPESGSGRINFERLGVE